MLFILTEKTIIYMINLDEKADIINETLKKISFILNQSRKQELNRESFIKDILRLIFCDEKDLNKIRFPNISSETNMSSI